MISLLALGCTKSIDKPISSKSNSAIQDDDLQKHDQGDPDDIHQKLTLICEPSPIDLPEGCACFAPATNCLNYVTIRPSMESGYNNFVTHFENDSVSTFFENENWGDLFPGLIDAPNLINQIIREEIVFVELDNKNSYESLFGLVDSGKQNNYSQSDIILAIPFERE
jgi:hypothetical protein